MNHDQLNDGVAEAAKISKSQAEELLRQLFAVISEQLSVGEVVAVDGLGRFLTVKKPAEVAKGPDGHQTITLPVIEPEFEPAAKLVRLVTEAIKEHPERFATESPEEELGEEEGADEAPEPKPSEKSLGKASRIEFRDITNLRVDKEILNQIPAQTAKRLEVVPIDMGEGVLTVAMIDPEDFEALQLVRKETGLTIKQVLTTKDGLQAVLDQYTGLQAEVQEVIEQGDFGISSKELMAASKEDEQDQTNEKAPTARIVFSLLKRAVRERASDVHIEPSENNVRVRFRVDGVLQTRLELPKEVQLAITSRLKILANLKIDEQRLPQDGRFKLIFDGNPVDFRLSTIPVVFGEKIVMRILDKSVGILSLEDVGLADRGLRVLQENMRRSHGMILITGPTGSGKTTSLYAVLGKLMSDGVNILTLEDPVEYQIESINQSQVHAEIGYTFAAGLRSVVRQDPDIVMLGEIRDGETADMAIHAALTGHTVLSTLHTNDAAGAFPRLIDMGIEPFLITSSVHTVIAQRLARSICQHCKEETTIDTGEIAEVKAIIASMAPDVRKEFDKKSLTFFHGKGCEVCNGKGYKGRVGVFEVLNVTEPIRELVLKRSSGDSITQLAIKEGMVTMVQDGIIKVLRGLTTLEEVWRVTRE